MEDVGYQCLEDRGINQTEGQQLVLLQSPEFNDYSRKMHSRLSEGSHTQDGGVFL